MSNDIFEKCTKFTAARDLQAAGMYPYFKRVETVQGPVVKIDGKEKIVLCFSEEKSSSNFIVPSLWKALRRKSISSLLKFNICSLNKINSQFSLICKFKF